MIRQTAGKARTLEAMSTLKKMVLNPETAGRLSHLNGVGGLIGICRADAPKLVENLRRARGEKCPAQLRNYVHTLMGGSSNPKAEGFAAICRDLEMKGIGGALDGATRPLQGLEGQHL
jgi:hypothetical protein